MAFLDELVALRLTIPRLGNINVDSYNSDYCTHSDKNKNCYLLFAANFNEDSMYGGIILNSTDCVDCEYTTYSELCYSCVDITRCYNCNFSQDLRGCRDCEYCYECIGCSDCFGCAGLNQKQHHIFNKAVASEEYDARTAEWKAKGREAILAELEKLRLQIPHRFAHHIKTENCVGDFISESKNCYQCFDVYESEDCMYMTDCWRCQDSLDLMFVDGIELSYECFSAGLGTYNCNFSSYIRSSVECEYSELLFNCKNCFGCVGLQGKQFYILNQPYSKEDYSKKVADIKEEMRRVGSYGRHLETTYKPEDTALFLGDR